MITRNIGTLTEISSQDGYIHKIGTEVYFKRSVIADSINNYEEVTEIPKYTIQEYKERVRELVKERYNVEDEIAILANINSPMILSEDKVEEYRTEYLDYQSYREQCKIQAKEILNNGKANVIEGQGNE